MFTSEVAEKIQYYVYRLIDPRNGETFYVGKGKGRRVFSHANGEVEDDTVGEKLKRIREIKLTNFEVAHVIHRHGMDEKTALEVEAALIDAYPGLTNIQSGHHSGDRGVMHAKEIIARFQAAEIQPQHNLISISVNRSASEGSLYRAVRAAWRMSIKRADEADYVLAEKQGLVVGVFKPTRWAVATVASFPELEFEHDMLDRIGFVGVEADQDIQNLYVGTRIPKGGRGAANPIRYLNPES